MHRRSFVQGLTLVAAAMAAPFVLAEVASQEPAPKQSQAPSSQTFRNIAVVECTIVNMLNGKQRIVSIEGPSPIMINEGRAPFALSIAEDRDDRLSMTIYSRRNGELTEGQTTYIGRNSMQVLRHHGVVLQFVTHAL